VCNTITSRRVAAPAAVAAAAAAVPLGQDQAGWQRPGPFQGQLPACC
jgi:hypothetical protein